MGLVRKGLVTSFSSYMVMSLGMVQMVILSRALGPSGVGEMTLFRQTFLLSIQVASLGWPMAMIYQLNQNRVKPGVALASVSLVCGLLSLVTGTVIIVVLIVGEGRFFATVNTGVLLGAALWVPSVMLRAVYYNYQVARLNVRYMLLMEVIPPGLLCGWYAITWATGTINVTFAVMSEATILGGVSLTLSLVLTKPWRLIRQVPRGERIDWRFLGRTLPHGVKMAFSSILLLLNGYLCLTILRALSGNFNELGYFSRGLRLATISGMSIQAMQRLLYANWSGMKGERRARSVERTVNFTLSMVIVLGCAVFLAARPLTLLLFGRAFLPAVPITRITIAGVAVFLVIQLMQSLFNADNKSIYNVYILGIGLICNTLGGLLLVPSLQAQGSAWALLCSYMVMVIMALLLARSRYRLRMKVMLIPSISLVAEVFKSLLRRRASHS